MNQSLEQLKTETYNATIVKIRKITHDLAIFYLKEDKKLFERLPGQYISIGLYDENNENPKLIRRPYSVSSSLHNSEDYLELYIALVENGEFTPLLFKLNVGDRLFITPKIFGHYLLPKLNNDQTVIFASTGTGIAPHMTMLKQAVQSCDKVVIIDCVRYHVDLGYYEEIVSLQESNANLKYIPIITREEKVKRYVQDYFDNDILELEYGIHITPENTLVYACGNPKMIGIPKKDRETGNYIFPEEKGLIEILIKKYSLKINRKNEPGQIYFEKYW